MTSEDDLLGLFAWSMMQTNNADRPPERPAKVRCSNCGGEVERQARFCSHCGIEFVQVVPENIPQSPSYSEDAFRRCPKCRTKNLLKFERCEVCDLDLSDIKPREPLLNMIFGCGCCLGALIAVLGVIFIFVAFIVERF